MKTPRRHRLLTALALGALLATGFGASAEPAAKQDNSRKEIRKDKREQRQEQRKDRREDRKERKQERREDRIDRREDRREVRQDRREDRREVRQDRREDRQQVRARIVQQQQYQRIRAAQARQAAQRRAYRRSYGYPSAYRYSYGGRWHSTSHYGANMLRSAIQRGYQEGLRAGRSDRHDRWGNDYRRSRVWIDASFGYGGSYVSRSDYAHYFRQGFERGYEDGYYGRGRYGRYVNGEAVIIQAVLEAILGLQRLG